MAEEAKTAARIDEQPRDVTEALGRVLEGLQASTKATQASTKATQDATAATVALSSEVRELGTYTVALARYVGFSAPPPPTIPAPPPPPKDAPIVPLDTQITSVRDEVMTELKKQSSRMGIGVEGLKWLVSPPGRTAATQLALIAAAFYTTFRLAIAPAPPPPAPPAPYVLAPPAESR